MVATTRFTPNSNADFKGKASLPGRLILKALLWTLISYFYTAKIVLDAWPLVNKAQKLDLGISAILLSLIALNYFFKIFHIIFKALKCKYHIKNQQITDGQGGSLDYSEINFITIKERKSSDIGTVVFNAKTKKLSFISTSYFKQLLGLVSPRQPILAIFNPVKFKFLTFSVLMAFIIFGYFIDLPFLSCNTFLLVAALVFNYFVRVLAKSFYVTKGFLIARDAHGGSTDILFKSKVASVKAQQSIIAKWLNYATLEWRLADGSSYLWRDVSNFSQVKKTLKTYGYKI